jgi:hypothetical protein
MLLGAVCSGLVRSPTQHNPQHNQVSDFFEVNLALAA